MEAYIQEQNIKILLGKKIKNFRKLNKMTQFDLGEKANINQRQIALIETGKSFPSFKTLIKFSEIFACDIKDIFDFNTTKDTSELKVELNKLIDILSNNDLKRVYFIVNSLKTID